MKIAFLIHHVYGMGGTIRTTLHLAAALAERHEVEIASMYRYRDEPYFDVDKRVTLVPLVDMRPEALDREDPRQRQPAVVFPASDNRHRACSMLGDLRVEEYLNRCRADVLIGTRPGINVYLACHGSPRGLRIAQEHLTHDIHPDPLLAVLGARYRELDAVVTMTEADAAVYRRRMPLPGVRVTAIPNSVPLPVGPPSDGRSHVVAAAGRFVRSKRYGLLVDAFADVADAHPDWRLRLYGSGRNETALRRRIQECGMVGRAELMGRVTPIESAFREAAVVAVTSDAESFGMTLVEAMRCGVPVISTDCPLGPGEIIRDGVDGLLVPVRDRAALGAALDSLMSDDGRRRRMGQEALAAARRYDPELVASAYETLFAELAATRRRRAVRRTADRWYRALRSRLRPVRRSLRRMRTRLRRQSS